MYAKELIERSPIRALERSLKGGLGRGKVGVVCARPGVGKTACLVQVGLDALLRGLTVLHVSNESPVGHLRSYYDELFHELERGWGLENASSVLLDMERRRLLVAQPGPALKSDRLQEAASFANSVLLRDPDVIIVEGYDFEQADRADLEKLRALAVSLNAEMWLSVRTHRSVPVTHPLEYPKPVDGVEDVLDVILSLHAVERAIHLRVLKERDGALEHAEPLVLDAVSMQILDQSDQAGRTSLRRQRFVLHSGGAKGAEAAFGEVAESYGIRELTFSFDGHANRVRERGLRMLTEADLKLGDVSLRYVSHRLKRIFPQAPGVRKVLQSIWHQVRPCQQVFVIGLIQEDDTVRGGTGWGAELARRWKKDLFVFDQKRDGWFQWVEGAWRAAEPVIESPAFAGSGTANLEPNGRKAIEALFERSFGDRAE